MSERTIIIHNGILMWAEYVSPTVADGIARANNEVFAESLIRDYVNGTALVIDPAGKIKRKIPLEKRK